MSIDSTAAPRMIRHKRTPVTAFACILLFMVVYWAEPGGWVPGMGSIPLAKITGALVILTFFLALRTNRQRPPQEVIYLILFVVQLWIAALMSPVWKGGALAVMFDFTKVLLIFMAVVFVVNTMGRLRWLILVQATSAAGFTAAAIWTDRRLEGRLEGVLKGGIYTNPNELALSIAISVPLCLYFLLRSSNKAEKVIWALVALMMSYAVFLTASRSGLISLAAAAAMYLWEFAIRGRRRYLLVLTLISGVAFWVYAGKELKTRFGAEGQSGNVDQASAQLSAEARQDLLIRSIRVTAEHPLFGLGPGNFSIAEGGWYVTHNSYTQVSSEGGLPAFALFIMILWRGFANLAATKRLASPAGKSTILASALRASLVAFVFGAFFASESYQFFPYIVIAYTTALYKVTASKRKEGRSLKADRSPGKLGEKQKLPSTEPIWTEH